MKTFTFRTLFLSWNLNSKKSKWDKEFDFKHCLKSKIFLCVLEILIVQNFNSWNPNWLAFGLLLCLKYFWFSDIHCSKIYFYFIFLRRAFSKYSRCKFCVSINFFKYLIFNRHGLKKSLWQRLSSIDLFRMFHHDKVECVSHVCPEMQKLILFIIGIFINIWGPVIDLIICFF